MMAYSLRLALLSLKKHLGFSLIMATAIAFGLAAFTASRATGEPLNRDPFAHRTRLFHLEIDAGPAVIDRLDPARYAPIEQGSHALLTYHDFMAIERIRAPRSLAAGIATRGAARAGGKGILVDLRGTTRDAFPIFDRTFHLGAAWGAEAELRADRVAVLNPTANQELFGGEHSVGRRFSLLGEEFTVIGVLDAQRSLLPLPRAGRPGIAIPLTTAIALRVRPLMTVAPTERAATYDDFLASDARWIDAWIEFDDEPARRAYEARLDEYAAEERGRGHAALAAQLVPRSAWWARHSGDSGNTLFALFCDVLLVACTFNLGKLLLAKYGAQARATALFRACGATRREVFLQLILEAELVGIAGGVLGLGIAAIAIVIINPLMPSRPYDSAIDLASAARTMAAAVIAAFIAGVYPAWHTCRISPAEAMRR
jgi:putative ABC transport system permease protein